MAIDLIHKVCGGKYQQGCGVLICKNELPLLKRHFRLVYITLGSRCKRFASLVGIFINPLGHLISSIIMEIISCIILSGSIILSMVVVAFMNEPPQRSAVKSYEDFHIMSLLLLCLKYILGSAILAFHRQNETDSRNIPDPDFEAS